MTLGVRFLVLALLLLQPACQSSTDDRLNRTMPNLTSTDDRLNGIMPNLTSTNDRLNGAMPNLTSTDDRLNGAMPNLASTDDRLNGIMPNLTSTDDRLNGIMPNLTSTDDRLNGAMPNWTSTDDRLNGIMPNLTSTDDRLNGIMPNLTSTDDRLNGIMPNLTSTDDRLNGIMPNLTSTDHHHNRIMPNLTSTDHHHNRIMPNLTSTDDRLNGAMPNLTSTYDRLNGAMPNLTSADDRLNGAMPNLTSADDRPNGSMPNLTSADDRLNGAMPNLTSTNDRPNGSMPNLTSADDRLHGTMPNLTSADDRLHGTMPNLTSTDDRLHGTTPNLTSTDDCLNGATPNLTSTDVILKGLMPYMTKLCPGLEVCGIHQHVDENTTLERNTCCQGCSCDENCREIDNCCFPNTDPDDLIYECLVPATNQQLRNVQKYRFVVKEPPAGCVALPKLKTPGNVSCSPNEMAAPWGNFLPVYSKTLNKNFKNAACGRCYGAEDLVEWLSLFEFTGTDDEFAESITLFNEKGILFKSHLQYLPPNAESKSSEKKCFNEIDTCSLYPKDRFYVPSSLQMERPSIIEACNNGPRALYIRNINRAYKNVFCAICDGTATVFIDDVLCEYTGEPLRTSSSSFRTLIDSTLAGRSQLKHTEEHRKEVPCYKPKHDKNDTRCAELQCPILQTRLDSDKCGFGTKLSTMECMDFCLTLTTTEADEEDIALLLNMDDTKVYDILEDNSPWSAAWKIVVIGKLVSSKNLELYVCMLLKSKQVKLQSLTRYVSQQLRKSWRVNIRREITFKQEISKHGMLYWDLSRFAMIPWWSKFSSAASLNLTIPSWQWLFIDVDARQSSFCVPVTKMMFCEQVELSPDDYNLDDRYAVLHLTDDDRVLYPNEYTAITGYIDGGFQVRVCLKDSGYVKMEHSNGGGYLKPVLTIMVILYFMTLAFGKI